MSSLVLYFSLEGHTDVVAKIIAEVTGSETERIELEKAVPKGFLKYLICGYWTVSGFRVPIKPIKKLLDNYHLIFIGTPVWAGNYSAVINTLMSNYRIENKKVALFVTYGLSKGRSIEKLEKDLRKFNNTICGSIGFKEIEINQKDYLKKRIEEWWQEIKKLQS